jgi:peptidoglycan/LPS O-acetylase OafA/YrhL
MNKLFQNLIWPAVAGNVAWAFFSIAIGEKWKDIGVAPRLLSLLLLAIYLCYDWTTTDVVKDRLKHNYWIGDAFHTVTIVVFAISAQSKDLWDNIDASWTNWTLIIVYLTTAIGHLTGIWEPEDVNSKRKWKARIILAGFCLIGVVVYIFSPLFFDVNTLWHLPISIASILIFWFPLRDRLYSKTVTYP